MRSMLRKWLRKKGFYNRIKYSFPFRIYQKIFKRYVIKEEKKEINFYRSFLGECHLVFDIGTYDGHKTTAFLNFSDKVISCEPDLYNLKILKTRFRNNKHRVHIENVAVSDKNGIETLLIHHQGSAFNTLNPKWKTLLEADDKVKWNEVISFTGEMVKISNTTLDQLISKYGAPEFIKIDVEGYENKVLAGLTHTIPCISFECMLPNFEDELLECLVHIRRLSPVSLYNVAEGERLIFPNFISEAELKNWVNETKLNHFEIVVKNQS